MLHQGDEVLQRGGLLFFILLALGLKLRAFDHAAAALALGNAVAPGHLDEAIRELGDYEDERELKQDDPPGQGCGGVALVEQLQDGEMPQVDGVGALADPLERLDGKDACQHGALRHGGGDGAHGDDRAGEDAAVIRERGVPLGEEHHGDKGEGAGPSAYVDQGFLACGKRACINAHRLVKRQHKRQPAADGQAHGARVGAVVGTRRVLAGHVQIRHERGGCQRGHDEADADATARGLQLEGREQNKGPDYVELCLDGQRPEVRER